MYHLVSTELSGRAWTTLTRRVRRRLNALTQSEVLGPTVLASVGGLAAGLVVVLALNWQSLGSLNVHPARVNPPQAVEAALNSATTSDIQAVEPAFVVSNPTATSAALPESRSDSLAATQAQPETPATAIATAVVVATAETAESAWQALLPNLDAVWEVDFGQTISLLDGFRGRFPEFAPAKEKLYVALLARADGFAKDGSTSAALDELSRAEALLPERPEARAARFRLTPTATPVAPTAAPVPAPAVQARQQPAPIVRAAPQQLAPIAVPQRQSPPLPAATPTKSPFHPLGGP